MTYRIPYGIDTTGAVLFDTTGGVLYTTISGAIDA